MSRSVNGHELVADLRRLGVTPGGVLLAHISLSSLGRVVDGASAVLDALRTVLGAEGTLVMPSQSWQLCDPAYLADEAVPAATWAAVRDALPVYDPERTPTRTMGVVAEALRTMPGTLRSAHPHRSFIANGPRAAEILARHDLDDPVGEGSPLAAVERLDGQILLLGVGHDKNTSLHLAEAHSGLTLGRVPNGAPLLVDGARRWVAFDEPAVDDADFVAVGAAFEAAGGQRRGTVGEAPAALMSQRTLVAFAAVWFAAHRGTGPSRTPESITAPVGGEG